MISLNNNNNNNNKRGKRGAQVRDESGMRVDETTTIKALGAGKRYKFLGVLAERSTG